MLQNKSEGAEEEAGKVFRAIAEGIQQDIQDAAPKKTGKMASSIKVEFTDPLTLHVSASVIAAYQEYGTKPHVIRPVKSEFLVFKTKDGRWVKTKKVNHPGTPPRPFIRPVINQVFKDLGDKLGRMGAALNSREQG